MKFSKLLSSKGDTSTPSGDDIFCMVNGKPSNAEICEQMLDGEKADPEVTSFMVEKAKELGFSEEDAKKFWG